MKKFQLCCLLIAIVAIYIISSPRSLPRDTSVASSLSYAGPYNVMAAPTLDAARLDAILCAASSPACHTGDALYSLGVQAGVNPVYALAFFQHESTFGRYGVARVTLSLGNIRCTPGWPHCIDGFRAYPSWQAGYADWYQLIRYYCLTLNRCTVGSIIPLYAPSTENDTQGYIAAITLAVDTWSGSR